MGEKFDSSTVSEDIMVRTSSGPQTRPTVDLLKNSNRVVRNLSE
jgi:hypothetical protein